MLLHAEQRLMIDQQGHEDLRRHGETRGRARPDPVDEQQSGDDHERADDAAERRLPGHAGEALDGRQGTRQAEPQNRQKRDDRQERDEAREPRIGERIPPGAVHRRPPGLQGAGHENDRVKPGATDARP
jgi:hypothetical protein